MKTLLRNFLLGLSALSSGAYAQSDFYEVETIREVKIYFEETNWDHILDSLYGDDLQERLIGDLTIDGQHYTDVGIRYKGYSSASAERVKNPLNIKLDYVNSEQNHEGFDKIKLSNVIHDPSFVREVLAYEVARKYMPASRANFANVYINDVLIGLYTNVESVEEDFLDSHFGSSENTFFKGNPETLDLDGENSNLSNSHGTDFNDYEPFYTQKSKNEADWENLYEFIDILNTNDQSLNDVLNIDRALWMHAFNYSMINFDSYIGYAQNYYLYQSDNGQFNPIIWDLNQSFGSYRLTDASTFWAGFSILEAKNADPLQHFNSFSITPRPLMTVLFENDTYRKMYLAHLRTIMEENFNDADYLTRAMEIQSLIEMDVLTDPNKFYSDEDFHTNVDTTVNDLIDYIGLRDLMENRSNYLSTYPGMSGAPLVVNTTAYALDYQIGDAVSFTAEISDADEAFLYYRFQSNAAFSEMALNDDGINGDTTTGDGVYTVVLDNAANFIEYYFYAQNETTGKFSPRRAAYEFHTLFKEVFDGQLVINEFVAKNESENTDGAEEMEDWIELYNRTDAPLSTKGLFLSDTIGSLFKCELEEMLIPAKGYLVIWADEDLDEGKDHINMRLAEDGEDIVLSNAAGLVLDFHRYDRQNSVFSSGRYPNGVGEFTQMQATFSVENIEPNEVVFQSGLHAFPVPTSDILYLTTTYLAPFTLEIINGLGQSVLVEVIETNNLIELDVSDLGAGFYTVNLIQNENKTSKKIILTD